MKYVLVLVMAVLVMLGATQAFAAILFSDDFESYQMTDDGWNLDMNGGGPNANDNGNLAGNPWWGPAPSNADIVTQEYTVDDPIVAAPGVAPHSGSQMVAGWYGGGTIYYNMAYRLNGNRNLTGGFAADWWFYDAIGTKGNLTATHGYWADSVSIVNYNSNPITLDYPDAAASNFSDADFGQRISLGASNDTSTGYNRTKYQARIKGIGAVAGAYGTNGWVNLNISRSVGWHHGRIVVGAADGNGSSSVSFFIDNMQSSLLTTTANSVGGYNLLELQCDTKIGSTWGYWPFYDDVSISSVPEPGSLVALAAGLVSLLGLRRRRTS